MSDVHVSILICSNECRDYHKGKSLKNILFFIKLQNFYLRDNHFRVCLCTMVIHDNTKSLDYSKRNIVVFLKRDNLIRLPPLMYKRRMQGKLSELACFVLDGKGYTVTSS